MTGTSAHPILSATLDPPQPEGLAALAKRAFDGEDLNPLNFRLIERMVREPPNAAVLMDLSIIEQLIGNPVDALGLQMQALEISRIYRRPASGKAGLNLLAFVAPGDFMANTPLDFLLAGSDVRLDMVYITRGEELPAELPDHDLAFVAIGESEENQPILRQLADQLRSWPRPMLNAPEHIARLSRDGAAKLLQAVPGIVAPMARRCGRADLMRLARQEADGDSLLSEGGYPVLVRPIGSHAGQGLEKLDAAVAIDAYLREHQEREFYLTPFIDYRSTDGQFRKARIALIDGKPYVSHMAISDHWMIHYLNAGMRDSAEKRAEESRFMEAFDRTFAARHEAAFHCLTERVGLDYVALDCGETRDGDLLIFEVDVAMIVHSMDPPSIFPYKAAQMRKLFTAFRDMLAKKAGSPTA